EHVELEPFREVVVKELQAELPFGIRARPDRDPQITPVEDGVGAVDLHGLVPCDRLETELGLPMELHERRGALRVDEPERVDAEALHESERPRDRTIRRSEE